MIDVKSLALGAVAGAVVAGSVSYALHTRSACCAHGAEGSTGHEHANQHGGETDGAATTDAERADPNRMTLADAEDLSPEAAPLAQLQRGYRTLREAVRTLRAANAQSHGGAGSTGAQAANAQGGSNGASRSGRQHENIFPATREELAERARNCELELDLPPVLSMAPNLVDQAQAERNGLSEAERLALNDAISRVFTLTQNTLRPLYVEATGDEAGAMTLAARTLIDEIRDKAAHGEDAAARQRIARELLGEVSPPADLSEASAYERMLRFVVSLGDELERTFAVTVGADRAREVRAAHGGWPWSRWGMSGCPDEQPR